MLQVPARGVQRHREALRDLFHRQPVREQRGDLRLGRSEVVKMSKELRIRRYGAFGIADEDGY